jgi:hypothetical protein
MIYFFPFLDILSIAGLAAYDLNTIFWYVWSYSTPIIVIIAYISDDGLDSNKGWLKLFLSDPEKIKKVS